MKIISKITIDCVEHEDVVYYRWKENDWYVQGSVDILQEQLEDCLWLEELFQEAKRKQGLKDAGLDDLDVMGELNG